MAKSKVKKQMEVKFLEFATPKEMEMQLNLHLSAGWLLLDLKSEFTDHFWQSNSAWLGRKTLVSKMNKLFNDSNEKNKAV
jgi:hypothetical protein